MHRGSPSIEGDSSFCGGWGRQAPGGAQSPQKVEKSSFCGGWQREEVLRDHSSSSVVKFKVYECRGQSSTVIDELTFFGKRRSMFAYILGDIAMKTGSKYFQKF